MRIFDAGQARRPGGHLPPDGARPGHRDRDGARQALRAGPQALDLRPGRALARRAEGDDRGPGDHDRRSSGSTRTASGSRSTGPTRRGRRRLVLLLGPAARTGPRARPATPDPRHRWLRVARVPLAERPSARPRRPERPAAQLEQQGRARASCTATTRTTARSSTSSCSTGSRSRPRINNVVGVMNNAAGEDANGYLVWPVVRADAAAREGARCAQRPACGRARRRVVARKGAPVLGKPAGGPIPYPGAAVFARGVAADLRRGDGARGTGSSRRTSRTSSAARPPTSTRTSGRCSAGHVRGRYHFRYCGRGNVQGVRALAVVGDPGRDQGGRQDPGRGPGQVVGRPGHDGLPAQPHPGQVPEHQPPHLPAGDLPGAEALNRRGRERPLLPRSGVRAAECGLARKEGAKRRGCASGDLTTYAVGDSPLTVRASHAGRIPATMSP